MSVQYSQRTKSPQRTPRRQQKYQTLKEKNLKKRLGDIPEVKKSIQKGTHSDLKLLHHICFNFDCNPKFVVENLLLFDGFSEDTDVYMKKEELSDMEKDELERIAALLGLKPATKAWRGDALVDSIVGFLILPTDSSKSETEDLVTPTITRNKRKQPEALLNYSFGNISDEEKHKNGKKYYNVDDEKEIRVISSTPTEKNAIGSPKKRDSIKAKLQKSNRVGDGKVKSEMDSGINEDDLNNGEDESDDDDSIYEVPTSQDESMEEDSDDDDEADEIEKKQSLKDEILDLVYKRGLTRSKLKQVLKAVYKEYEF